MKVLWFSNGYLSDTDLTGTGTWLDSMARGLLSTNQVELGIVTFGSVDKLTQRDYHQVKQWIVPITCKLGTDGLPARSLVAELISVCQSFGPDLIHVWGTESFWGLLPTRKMLKAPSVLNFQGVCYRIASCYYGGLTGPERLACIGLREMIKTLMLRKTEKTLCAEWGSFEAEIMAGHRWAICQTPWQEAQMVSNRLDATLFRLDLPLRKIFEQSDGWKPHAGDPRIFCFASGWHLYKGLHVAIRALALLKRRFPNVQLRIGGTKEKKGIFRDGYLHWVATQIRALGLGKNVHWLGPLKATQIIEELRGSSAVVIPTFIESYCMAFAEAMRIGTPTVVSYTGGTAVLGKDEETCLFFPPGDEAMCAYQLDRVLSDHDLTVRISLNSRDVAKRRNDTAKIIQEQLNIYQQIVTDS